MSARPILLLSLALLGLMAVGSPSEARSKKSCSSKGSVMFLRTERVRIIDKNHVLYGCNKRAASEVHKLDCYGPNTLDTFVGPPWDMSLDLGESLGVTVYWANLDGLHSSRLIGF